MQKEISNLSSVKAGMFGNITANVLKDFSNVFQIFGILKY